MNNNQLAIIAIVAALALLGVVMVLVANNLAIQEAEAAKSPTGRCASFLQNSRQASVID